MLLEWVVISTLLILAVTALRALLGKRVSAGLRYGLWAVVLVRLLVPVQLFTLPISTAVLWESGRVQLEKAVLPSATTTLIKTEHVDQPVLALPASDSAVMTASDAVLGPLPVWQALGWVWLAGAAAMAAAFVVSNVSFACRLRRARTPLEGVDCSLPVYIVQNLPSPCLFGLVRPAVYVPFETAADTDMLRHILAHEYTHYRHGDHVWNVLRSIALAVHWWNPLVWLAVVFSRRDCELACDEGALRRLGDGERIAYGRTLLALLTERPRAPDLLTCATTMTGGQKSVFERVTRIAHAPKRWLWAAVAAVLVTALACICAFGSAEEKAPEKEPNPTETSSAGIDLSNIPADLSLSLDQQEKDAPFVRINGTVDGENLPRGAFWYPANSVMENYPYGHLSMVNPDFTDGIEGLITASWLDTGHTSVILSTATQAMLSSYAPSGYWEFVVDVDRWAVTRMEAMDETTLPAPVKMYPESITEEEAVRAARIAAKLLTEAEGYYLDHLPVPAPEEGSLPFDTPMKLWFGSGAGAWRTILTLHPDGSFEGDYSDSDMGDGGESYPNGTQYVCRFHGRFGNITQKTSASWSMTLDEMVIDAGHPVGEVWIEDGVRYIASSPYGMDGKDGKSLEPGARFMLYTPDAKGYAPGDELYGMRESDDYDSVMYQFWTWWPNKHGWEVVGDTLDSYGLCNMETGYGFFDFHAWGLT